MQFVFYGYDKKDHLPVRMENRPAHVSWLKSSPCLLAGPLLIDDGDMCGSMVVMEADDLESAEALFAQDPYAQADLFETSSVTQWNWVIGKPE